MLHLPAPRLPTWIKRLAALLAVFVLLSQSVASAGQHCALLAALHVECCADEADSTAPTEHGHGAKDAAEHPHDANGNCSCPFECAPGCCSPTRAVMAEVCVFVAAIAASGKLALTEAERTPISADPRGILHVPKLAA